MKLTLPVLALTGLALSGCYAYAPVGIDAVSPGETIRAQLTSEATDRLPAGVRGNDRSVVGELLARDAGGLTLFVPSAVRQEGFYAQNLHESIRLAPSDVLDLERRSLNQGRTYLALGVGTAALAGIALKVFTGKTGGSTIDRTDQGPAPNVIPLFKIRIP